MTGPRLVVVGPPGAGKTTVGTLVAAKLGIAFLDTDQVVEAAAGKTVADIFIEDGEERFRALEHEAVVRALAEHDGVLALGGGAVMDGETRHALQPARVAALQVTLSDAVARVGLARDRPLLLDSPRARIAAMLRDRAPLYDEVTTRAFVTADRSPDDIAAEIVTWLDSSGPDAADPNHVPPDQENR
jgi:shikimate kinase